MQPVYIVKTSWEIFVALTSASYRFECDGVKSIFVLEDSGEVAHHRFDLKEFSFISESITVKLPKNKYEKAIKYHYNLYVYLRKYLDRFLSNDYEVNVFIDQGILGQFFIKRKKYINLFEHGNGNYLVGAYPNFKLPKIIMGITEGYGRNEYVKSVYLQYPDKAPVDIKDKCQLLDLTGSFRLLPTSTQTSICRFFGVDSMVLDDKCSVLLTQPLSEDGFYSESQKIEIYKEIISRYKDEKLVIKPHPRDLTNYKIAFPDVPLLSNSFPMEILNFVDVKFEHAITICSGSVFNFDYPIKVSFIGTKNYPNLIKSLGDLPGQTVMKSQYANIKYNV